MNWLLYILAFVVGFLLTFNILYVIVVEKVHRRKVELLKERVEIWGRCCYTMGYRDGWVRNESNYKTQEQVTAEAKEQKSADQTISKAD